MKQEIHTIPIFEALEAGEECPFCRLQRQAEQRAIRFFAGPSASYMEPGIRAITNAEGFCPGHMKKLYDYGNALGAALMLQTYMESILQDLQQVSAEKPQKRKFRPGKAAQAPDPWQQLQGRVHRCAICDQVEENIQRQYRVFFSLLKEPEFRALVEHSKGFCLEHYARLMQQARQHLPAGQAEWFYATAATVMLENMQRVKADLDGLIAKYDYRNAGTPWGNSKDALQRAMQKLSGIFPADPPYRKD